MSLTDVEFKDIDFILGQKDFSFKAKLIFHWGGTRLTIVIFFVNKAHVIIAVTQYSCFKRTSNNLYDF